MIPTLALVAGCDYQAVSEAVPGPFATGAVWTEGGLSEPLSDGLAGLATVSDGTGDCEPVDRVVLLFDIDERQVWLDLAAYTDGAQVITPEPPFVRRAPTLVRPEAGRGSDPVFLSGGPASFTLDAAGVHTLTLEAPMLCRGGLWSVTLDECEVSEPVTVTFVADLEPARCEVAATGSEAAASAGPTWCVTDQVGVGSCEER